MPRRLIDLDDELLMEAQRQLGTADAADTVRAALQRAAARPGAGQADLDYLMSGSPEDTVDPELIDQLWR